MEKPTCSKCVTTTKIQKAGFNRGGSQRYQCQQCKGYFTPQPKPMGYDPSLREEVLTLYLEGNSMRGIAKVKRVNHQTVANWINAYHEQIPEDTRAGGGPRACGNCGGR
jgi:transposase-like protein